MYGDHFVMYTNVESRGTPETNTLYVNYTSKTKQETLQALISIWL